MHCFALHENNSLTQVVISVQSRHARRRMWAQPEVVQIFFSFLSRKKSPMFPLGMVSILNLVFFFSEVKEVLGSRWLLVCSPHCTAAPPHVPARIQLICSVNRWLPYAILKSLYYLLYDVGGRRVRACTILLDLLGGLDFLKKKRQ